MADAVDDAEETEAVVAPEDVEVGVLPAVDWVEEGFVDEVMAVDLELDNSVCELDLDISEVVVCDFKVVSICELVLIEDVVAGVVFACVVVVFKAVVLDDDVVFFGVTLASKVVGFFTVFPRLSRDSCTCPWCLSSSVHSKSEPLQASVSWPSTGTTLNEQFDTQE